MAKKMPLIISTLSLFSGLASPSVWASDMTHSLDGPWSFEEMMAAEAEIQPIIDEVCPYEFVPESCARSYIADRRSEDPIYYRLTSFEYDQFHILSLDPNPKDGKENIEYHFVSENSIEKYTSRPKVETDGRGNILRKYFDPNLYTHTISRLYIYQTETGFSVPISSDQTEYENTLSSPDVRILYSGSKSESENSLLPIDQKGSLEINAASLDPKYYNRIYTTFVDEKGKTHETIILLTDCHQGGDYCKLQYAKDVASPLLVNKPTYEEGYADGYQAGLSAGQNAGYESGYEDGHADGKTDGYTSGFNDGIEEGRVEGYDEGYGDGYNDGRDQGRIEGFDEGYMIGRDDGWMEGYDNGYNDGYNDGFDSGYQAAMEEIRNNDNQINSNDDDNTDDTNGHEDTNNPNNDNSIDNHQTINQNITINSASSLTTESDLSNSTKTKLPFRTPNTGAPNGEESSVEFPWWLGAIFIAGLSTLAWLFIPNRKKSSKKS